VTTAKCQGWWLAPDGAVPAARIAASIAARGTGSSVKSRQVRRLRISSKNAWAAAVRAASVIGG
jgi:hypothetical protein